MLRAANNGSNSILTILQILRFWCAGSVSKELYFVFLLFFFILLWSVVIRYSVVFLTNEFTGKLVISFILPIPICLAVSSCSGFFNSLLIVSAVQYSALILINYVLNLVLRSNIMIVFCNFSNLSIKIYI